MELGESMEDYLEATYLLKRKHGYVRNTMLCRYMNYTKASISVAMKLLAERGYVVRDQKGCIDLTEKGEKAATEVYARHLLLKELLEGIGVSSEIAEKDACRMEHVISDESFKRLQRLVYDLRKENWI